jgi:sugar O-acyltransferase (sialic acid O-acetyltransferase NeuD family)
MANMYINSFINTKGLKLALYGASGHAREVAAQMNSEVTFFVDDEYVNEFTKSISEFDPNEYCIMIAIGNSNDRHSAFKKLPKETTFFSFIHPTSILMGNDVHIGNGSFIGAYSILTTNIKIGNHALLNRGNHIGHDTTIGNFFSAMPGSIVSGNVNIGDNVYIGTNSSIREKTNICSSVTLGMNSCILNNINEPGTYVGSPAKKIK